MSSEAQDDRIFKALAHPRRRLMLDELKDGPRTTGALCETFSDMDRCTVMQHLKVLEEAGLVTKARQAQRRPVHLEAQVFDLMTAWIERYRRQAEERYARLDAVLADLNAEQEGMAS